MGVKHLHTKARNRGRMKTKPAHSVEEPSFGWVLEKAMDLRCDYCLALPDQPCRRIEGYHVVDGITEPRYGRVIAEPHQERRDRARSLFGL